MIELWLVDLEAAAPALEALERETPRLAADDRARALRAADAHEQRHRLAAYTALRVVLERFAGPAMRGRKLLREASGKPHFGPGAPAFSLAHIEGLALIGVGEKGAIGVDLERSRTVRLSARRREEIVAVGAGLAARAAHDPVGEDAVLRAWCRLEAFSKAHGGGISHVLTEIGVRGRSGRQLALGHIETTARALAKAQGLQVADVSLPAGLFAAAAAPGLRRLPRPRRFPLDTHAIALIAKARRTPPG